MRNYVCIFLPRWPLQWLFNGKPGTRNPEPETSTAIFERGVHGAVLLMCSAAAQRAGLRRGMSVADARALAPDLILHESDDAAYREELERLCLWCTRFSPLAGIEPAGPHARYRQAILLDVTGCEHIFGGEEKLLERIVQDLKQRGYRARVALASTIGAAWALAHYQTVQGSRFKVQGCKATKSETLNLEPKTLNLLPLSALRLDAATIGSLHMLGLKRIGDVLRQPRETLPSRFGPALLERLDQALGAVPEVLQPLRPAPEFYDARAFEHPVRDWQMLFLILESMTETLAFALQRAERGARQIECWLHHELAEPVCVEVALHRGSAGRKHLWNLLRTRLEDVVSSPAARRPRAIRNGSVTIEAEEGVCAASLQILSSEPLDAGQLALFEQSEHGEAGSLALLLDRLVTRLGKAAVLRAQTQDDPLPERAFRLSTLGTEVRGQKSGIRGQDMLASNANDSETAFCRFATQPVGLGHPSLPNAAERPLQLLPDPEPIGVDWPREVRWRGRRHAVRSAQGPERIESGWWRETRDERRDYYIVETQSGARHWIFQRLADHRWFLHGLFA